MQVNSGNIKYRLILKFLKHTIISGVIFILSSVILLGIAAYVFQERIEKLFVETINQNLETEVTIENINLNLIRHFPMASITFTGVDARGSGQKTVPSQLLIAHRIHFKFSLWNLIIGNYTIREVRIENASLSLKRFSDGTTNFHVWRTDTLSSNNQFEFNVKEVELHRVHFVYQDHLTHHLIDLAVNKTNLRGQFRLMNYLLEAKGTLNANQIMLDSAVFVRNRPVEIDILLNVLNNREFQFQKGQIRLNDNLFDVKGTIASTLNGVLFDTHVHGQKLHLGRLLNDLPENFHKYIDGYRAKGILQADAKIVGLLN
ncbi:MAG TPA: hypothetical protein VLH61_04275, partial [Bacteroidales bacterium]|nr:hypothetical protein [Bacteroidales bacterium]